MQAEPIPNNLVSPVLKGYIIGFQAKAQGIRAKGGAHIN